ncbi:MAG: MotA/TolQ/ExbB proton channel family protein [Planctomycetota bacterium]
MLVLLACVLSACWCADLAEQATQVRQEAESQLQQRRTAILAERTALSAQLQQTATDAASARAERVAAEEALAKVVQAEPQRKADHARQDAELDHLEQRIRDLQPQLAHLNAAATSDSPVTDRHGLQRTVPVLELGPRRVALGPDEASRGAVLDGRVVGRPLPPFAPGVIPLDVSGRLANQQPTHTGLAGWLAAGRLFIWPILAVGAIGLWLTVWRLRSLLGQRPNRTAASDVVQLIRESRLDEARARCAAISGNLAAILRCGIDRIHDPRQAREAAIDAELIAAESRLTRGIGMLVLLASIAPLLGLLGTVTGMIDLFGVIATQGAGQARGLSGGISEALITTQAGMLVAVPLLVAHAVLVRLSERQRLVLEETSAAILAVESTSP